MAARYLEMTRSGSPTSTMRPWSSHRDAVADRLHVADRVRDEQDGDAARAQLVDLAHAALPEVDVADRQRFVHQQDLRIDIDRDREGQPHHHAARIGLHRLIDEVADLGEGRDILVALVDLPRGQPENRAVQVDVVAAGEFRVEAGARVPAAPRRGR